MNRRVWSTEPDGTLSAEVEGYRLVVEAAQGIEEGVVRFRVLEVLHWDILRDAASTALTGSGFETSVPAAMAAALRMVERFLGHPLFF